MPRLTEEKKSLVENFIKEKVFEEGIKLLKENKANLFTMTELAENIGVAKGTLYNYFQDKLEVIYFISEKINEELLEKIEQHFRENPEDYIGNLRFLFRTKLEGLRLNRFMNFAAVTLQYESMKKAKKKDAVATSLYESIVTKNIEMLSEFFAAGQSAGAFKAFAPDTMAAFVNIHFLGINAYAILHKSSYMTEKEIENAIAQTEAMLLAAVCRERSEEAES